jgi:hypothetical protein
VATQQLTIDVGTNPNDGTGDPLRDAMVKVNDNFANLFAAPIVNTSVTVGTSLVNTYINSTAVFVGNNNGYVKVGGTASQTTNAIVNSTGFYTSGTVNAQSGYIVSNTLNLGTASKAANGYTFLPNGLKMNWGTVTANNTTAGNVTFTSAFSTQCFGVTCTGNNEAYSFNAAVLSSNTTAAIIRTNDAASSNVFFMAIGY